MQRTTIVMDNGTGYTKMGLAASGNAYNSVPTFVIPTIIAEDKRAKGGDKMGDLDFFIGTEAEARRKTLNVKSPIRDGVVDDWDSMEKFWNRCLYGYLQCNPEEHYMLLTEPPLNPPENREYAAEIMFETFQVPGLYIGVQAVLALIASKITKDADKVMTGTVVDSGDGVTHVIPVVDGYVIGSCIQHIPLAGSHITDFIVNMLRERKEPIPPVDIKGVARDIKERYCYAVPKLEKEFAKYDNDPSRFKVYEGIDTRTKKPYKVDVGYERFLGPEIFFNPEIFSSEYDTPLSVLVDTCIQEAPIDARRTLYKNICLSGGSTMFKDFGKRLERDIKRLTKGRTDIINEQSKTLKSEYLDVNVITHRMQRFAVWFGGAALSQLPQFSEMVITREDYMDQGPRIARASRVLASF